MQKGKLYGIGLGPGDPELITLKGLRMIERSDVIAYHQAEGKDSHALAIARNFIRDEQVKLPLIYPVTRQLPPQSSTYQKMMNEFYDQIVGQIASHLESGLDVSVIVAGDPLLYSSFLPIYQRLGGEYESVIIPGVISATAAAARAGRALCQGNVPFTILSALLSEDELLKRLRAGGAFAILKLGTRNFDKVKTCLRAAGREHQSFYIESATLPDERILPIHEVSSAEVPYFSLILVET